MAKKSGKQEGSEDYAEYFEFAECECKCADCGSVRGDKASPTVYRG